MTDNIGYGVKAIAAERERQIEDDDQEYVRADLYETARRTADYWKSEHNAANNEIERLRAVLASIAKRTFGSDPTWNDKELADYYAARFSDAQQKARQALNGESD